MKIRSLVVMVCLLQFSFLFASVHRLKLDTVPPGRKVGELPGIVIKRNQPMAKASGDTLQFDAKRYLKPEAFRLEDLVKNIPGFRVDDNGRIYFNGKEISRIMVDGDDLAGEQYKLLSRNLKALMVDSLRLSKAMKKTGYCEHSVTMMPLPLTCLSKNHSSERPVGTWCFQGECLNMVRLMQN